MKANLREKPFVLALLLPWIISFCVFWLYPLFYALYLSFTDYSTLNNEATFIGFSNYIALFKDPIFYKALGNTALFTFGTVPFTTSIALFIAVLINSRLSRFNEFYKTAFFMPSITSLVVISLIFFNLYSQDGYVNIVLKAMGLPYSQLGFLQDPETALYSIMVMDVWGAVGYYMILFLSSMQSIPNDLYASADISGANAWQKFRYITFPLLKPTLVFVIFINTIKSFQVFIEVLIMTKGGPLNSTTTLVYQIYTNAFEKSDGMGYASALAFIVFVILIIFTFIQHSVLKTKE